ncbi:uncharacterized protein [Antedon mediterranea]|uniref:uncharacterized protein n=1 Tax=Antedon mediterranea TaxID=105859 RepID=UPI003AF87D55
MDIGNWTFIFLGCFIELVLAGTNHQSNPYMFSKKWIQDNGVKDSYKKSKHTLASGAKINTNPHPRPSPEVNDHYTAISKGVTFSPTTPFIQVYRRPLRNRTVFSQRGPPWKSPNSVVQPTNESDMPNSTFVGILTGATIVFMLVWLPCYLYSETCLGGGRSDNTSNGSSDNISDDLEESDHPPSYNEALSSRTVSSFSFSTAHEGEAPPPSYDSLNILIQDLDKRVCRVTASTSYYSYRPSSAQQTTRVSSSRSFHGTSSYFSSGSLYQAQNNLSRVHKPKLLIRSFSFFEQPTLSEVQLEDDSQSSTDDPGESSDLENGSAAGSTTLVQRASKDLDDSSIEGLSGVPNYSPPTYRDECGGVSPSSDSSFSSSLLTVIEVKDDTNNIPHMQQLQDDEDDEDVIVMTV